VGRILEEYDTNKTYPVYGFGAKVSVAVWECALPFVTVVLRVAKMYASCAPSWMRASE
jgi:hypothetical protein